MLFLDGETKRVGEGTNMKLVTDVLVLPIVAIVTRVFKQKIPSVSALPLKIKLTIIARAILRRGHGTRPTADALVTLSKGLH